MSRWVVVAHGIVIHIRVSIPCLCALTRWNNRVRLREPSQRRVVPARIIEHETKASGANVRGVIGYVGILSGEGVTSWQGFVFCRPAHFAPGFVQGFNGFASDRVHGNGGGAEVVGEQVGERGGLRHGGVLLVDIFYLRPRIGGG